MGDSLISICDLLHVLVTLLKLVFLDLNPASLLVLDLIVKLLDFLLGLGLKIFVLDVELLVFRSQVCDSSSEGVTHFGTVATIVDEDISIVLEPVLDPYRGPFAPGQINFDLPIRLRMLQ